MIALITGGAGFIGSHLGEHLLENGYKKVIAVDDLSTGNKYNLSNLLMMGRRFKFVKGSITDYALIKKYIQKADVIFHLAAAVGVRLVVEKPVQTIETNIIGTEKILCLANRYKKRVLLTSTSEVYGKSAKCPFSENDDLLLGPTTKSRWSYACSKAIDEFLALAYYSENALPVVIARLFNTVGPRQSERYGMVLPNFVRQAISNKPITVFGDGKQSRCFCHVKDAVTGLRLLAESGKTTGEVFNVGNNKEISIGKLAERVKVLANSRSEIIRIPYEKAYKQGFEDIRRRIPDISKIKRAINFYPEYSTDDIIKEMISYYRTDIR
ncbi:MAG TPA: GDP-mannose 4,6-dehydratase [bacterium]